jgi:DNA-binding NarL/FixJ family response regulator
VLIVERDRRIRRGLRAIIELSNDLAVAGEAGSAARALELDVEGSPDVVVLDLLLPQAADGLALLAELSHRNRAVVAIGSSAYLEAAALAGGASTFLSKGPELIVGLTRGLRAAALRHRT